jgi:hypothetical protein
MELYYLFLALAALFIGACHLPVGRHSHNMFAAVAAIVCAAIAALLVLIPMFD